MMVPAARTPSHPPTSSSVATAPSPTKPPTDLQRSASNSAGLSQRHGQNYHLSQLPSENRFRYVFNSITRLNLFLSISVCFWSKYEHDVQ